MAELPADVRLILVHKQKTSARLRFLRFSHGMCAFTPLPDLSVVEGEGDEGLGDQPPVVHHPSAWLRTAETRLGLEVGSLKPEAEFHATVQTPDGPVTVQLASLDFVDPPFAEAEAVGGRFVDILEAATAEGGVGSTAGGGGSDPGAGAAGRHANELTQATVGRGTDQTQIQQRPARGCTPVEMELLRRAYTAILG